MIVFAEIRKFREFFEALVYPLVIIIREYDHHRSGFVLESAGIWEGIVSKQQVDFANKCLRETSFSGIFLYLLFVLSYCFMQTSAKGQSEKHVRVPSLLR